jgi:hypothetical protein
MVSLFIVLILAFIMLLTGGFNQRYQRRFFYDEHYDYDRREASYYDRYGNDYYRYRNRYDYDRYRDESEGSMGCLMIVGLIAGTILYWIMGY